MAIDKILGGLAAVSLVVGAAAQVSTSGVATATKVSTKMPALANAVNGSTLLIPAPLAPSATIAAPSVITPVVALMPLDLSTTWLWNWGGKWIGSEWNNGMSPLPWKHNRISQPAKADTLLTLDAGGSAQLQAGGAMAAQRDGLWEVEATLPKLKDGLVVAPLWLYDPASRDEIDFELAGRKGLDLTMHAYVNGVHKKSTVRLFAGQDLSNRRMRFGINVNQTLGAVEMFIDSKRVHLWERAKTGFFVTKPLKPWTELWAANPGDPGFVQWVGKWPGLATGEKLVLRVHGYGYTSPTGRTTY